MNLVEQFDRAFEEARLSPEVKQACESGGGVRLRSEWNHHEQEWAVYFWRKAEDEDEAMANVSAIQSVPLAQFLGAFEKREYLKDKMLRGIRHYLLVESHIKRKHS